jgi:hypothetical protein
MATEVEEIARRKSGDSEGGGDGDMSSYDDVEASAAKDLKDELGDKAAKAIQDYVKACISKASSDDSDDDGE